MKPRPLIPLSEWRDYARCLGKVSRENDPFDVDDSMWHAPREALAICNGCPVRVNCLADALKIREHGVRAGLTMRQRDALKRPRNRQTCPACKGKTLSKQGEDLQLCMGCGHSWKIKRSSTTAVERP